MHLYFVNVDYLLYISADQKRTLHLFTKNNLLPLLKKDKKGGLSFR